MSKEKQCECCHEWWYGSDVKEDLCPNCYYYFKQLKQQLAEKDKEIHSLIIDYEKRISQEQELMSNLEKELTELKEKDNYHLRYELAGADETITNLKKQLEEKDKEIEMLKLKLDIRAMSLQNINIERIESERNQKQLAIQELEKVKNFVDGRTYCADYIKKRIKELEGK